jgi:aminomethyltransferase
MVDFGGWDMPVQYAGLVAEHNNVRNAAGLFDVSHMGEIEIIGPEAIRLADYIVSNSASKLKDGQIQYTGLLYEHGGFVDDVLVHRVNANSYFLCVNASNQDKDFAHIRDNNRFDCEVIFASPKYAQIAIQGPRSVDISSRLTKSDLKAIKYYWFVDGEFAGVPARIARTGYTGEDGFEFYVAPEHACDVWAKLMDAGKDDGLKHAGLGARNTLRLEAGMALYGHEIDATITPLDAGLDWTVKFDKDFMGREALLKQKERGLTRKLTAFEMRGRGIGRDGYEVMIEGKPAGWVTSGSPSPTLNKNIGYCYLPIEHAKPGVKIEIMIRNQPVEAETIPAPFYKRPK